MYRRRERKKKNQIERTPSPSPTHQGKTLKDEYRLTGLKKGKKDNLKEVNKIKREKRRRRKK